MANKKISDLTSIPVVDAAVDVLEISDISAGTSNKVTRNGLLGITGSPLGTSDSQVITNKTISGSGNILTIQDNHFTLQDNLDNTKQLTLQLSGITTGTSRTLSVPDVTDTIVTLAATQTLTNKTLTSPAITGGTLANSTITSDSISGFSSANNLTIAGISIASSIFPQTALPTGVVVQYVSTNFSAVATGTTILPFDDTIPQNTEGDQYMTQAITPKSLTNRLSIEVTAMASPSIAEHISAALFQDATAGALAAIAHYQTTGAGAVILRIVYDMAAGTTSSTTFKVRIGPEGASTVTFNGSATARRFGGLGGVSNITIREYKA